MRGASQTIELSGSAEEEYVRMVALALRRARLNKLFPDGRRAADHVRLMATAVHGGLYGPIEVNATAGLPTYKTWVRTLTDHEVFAKLELPPRSELVAKAQRDPTSIFAKQLLQYDYREALGRGRVIPVDSADVQLVRVDREAARASFRVVQDKLDVRGLLTRTTIELSQNDKFWGESQLRRSGEAAEQTQGFRSLVYSMSGVDAEFLFARLAAEPDLTVTKVQRGTIGPFLLPGAPLPEVLGCLGKEHPRLVATFSVDLASVEQQEDRDNDPLSGWIADDFSEAGRSEYQRSREHLGYRVFRDRKFVVDEGVVSCVEAACRAAGTRNIVYPLEHRSFC